MPQPDIPLRGRPNLLRRIKRAARRLPLRAVGWCSVAAAGAAALAGAGTLAAALCGVTLLSALVDGWAWRHTRLQRLRERMRRLSARAERMDERLTALREAEAVHQALARAFGDVHAELGAPGTSGALGTSGAAGAVRAANPAFRAAFGDALPPAFEGETGETEHGGRTWRWHVLPGTNGRGEAVLRFLARDVSEGADARRAAEARRGEAEAAAARKGRRLAVAAHEIRNPLGGMCGMADLLLRGDLTPHQRAQVEALRRAANSLEAVLADLLDDARMESDTLVVEEEPFDLGALLEEVCELHAPEAHGKNVDIALHVAADVPPLVEGDANRVRQIVRNLVGNAVKFTPRASTPAGGVTVWAACENDRLLVSVADTGPGLDPHERERLFDPFRTGADGVSRRMGGVGLGLDIARRLAVAMGGTLAADEAERGASFTFSLPLQAVAPAEPPAPLPKRVVLATPNPLLAGPLRRFVEERGGHFVSGAEQAEPDDVVLFDEALEGAPPPGAVVLCRTGSEPAGERWLRLPLRRQTLDAVLRGGKPRTSERKQEVAPGPAVPAVRPRVLVAEDDPVTQLLVTAALGRAGARVQVVDTGGEAVRLFREAAEKGRPFDHVLLDLHLVAAGEGAMDGLAALAGMRRVERRLELPPVPVHVATGDASAATRTAATEAGASGVLVKPVAIDTLAALVGGERKAA